MPHRHGEPEPWGTALEVGHERGLADPRVAADEHDLRGAACRQAESLIQLCKLGLAPQKQRRRDA